MIKKLLFIIAISTTFTQQSIAQFALGDIAFTGYQGDNFGNPSGEEDEFTFVLLRDVAVGEQISFTENGWLVAGGFRTGENTCTLEFTTSLTCGTQISIASFPFVAIENVNGMSAGTLTGNGLSLATSGDQIFAYNPANTPSSSDQSGFIAAIQMNGDWDFDASSSTTSAQPSIFLTLANSSIAISPEVDNAVYNCTDLEDDDVAVLRAAIHNPANWNTNGTIPFDQPACSAISCSSTLNTTEFTLDNSISLYPNPSNGKITIRNSGIPLDKLQISDLNGRIVAKYDLNGNTESKEFNLDILSSGMYLITITSKNTSVIKKIVIN